MSFRDSIKSLWLYMVDRIKKDTESRKFQIMMVGTVLLCFGKLGQQEWLILALAYIGINVAQDWILRKNGGGE
jgi:hypothetical protein